MAKTVFISYSHRDAELKDELVRHLAPLRLGGLVDVWHDPLLQPGAAFSPAIEAELARSDLILLLISANFLASTYCAETEMVRAFERAERGRAQVVPIIVRPCVWHGVPVRRGRTLGEFLALPHDGRPVVEFPDHDVAWAQVVGRLSEMLVASGAHSLPFRTPSPAPFNELRAWAAYLSQHEAVLSEAGVQVVRHAAEMVIAEAGRRAIVVGHCDEIEDSLALSQTRATRVADLLTTFGVPREAIEVGWRGKDDPGNNGGHGRAPVRDRRVVIHIGT